MAAENILQGEPAVAHRSMASCIAVVACDAGACTVAVFCAPVPLLSLAIARALSFPSQVSLAGRQLGGQSWMVAPEATSDAKQERRQIMQGGGRLQVVQAGGQGGPGSERAGAAVAQEGLGKVAGQWRGC